MVVRIAGEDKAVQALGRNVGAARRDKLSPESAKKRGPFKPRLPKSKARISKLSNYPPSAA
jgi:hypothetical protein